MYSVTVKAAGFADASLKNLIVELNKTTTANLTMPVGAVSTTVQVVEATSAIDTTTAQVQSTYQGTQIVEMPIIELSGNFFGALNLSLLSAGVASNGGLGQGQVHWSTCRPTPRRSFRCCRISSPRNSATPRAGNSTRWSGWDQRHSWVDL